jgi:shikimate kinase
MHITLIGMSNIGKTHWSNLLAAESGFRKIDCDLLIERKLGPELIKLGYSGIRDVAKWMGQPFEPQYSETARKSIECERAVMEEVIEELRRTPAEKPLVIDPSGSVIYVGDDIAEQLRDLTRVIYLEASDEHRERLFQSYIEEPKPVVWGDNSFLPEKGERPEEALERCYPKLLESRAHRYEKMAHVTIPFDQHKRRDVNSRFLLKEIDNRF